MVDDTDPEAALRRTAERRVQAKAGFRAHVLVYAVANTGLVAINLATSPFYWWSVWPAFGWGIGLVAHGLSVYASDPTTQETAVRREMERLKGS